MSVANTALGRPCNPAFLALHQEEKFFAHVFIGNNVDYVDEVLEVLDYEASTPTVRGLFSQSRDAEFEGDIELFYRKNDWTLSLSPSRLTYYSLIRNEVLPLLSLYASLEHVFRAQKSWTLNLEWHLGLQARAVSRRFILTEFYVTDAVINNGEGLVDARTQNLLFIEPGVLWTPNWGAWEPHISAAATQTGLRSREDDEIPDSPEGEVGFSVKVPGLSGKLRMGPHVSLNARQHEEWDEKIRIAGVFDQDNFQGTFSFKVNQVAVGGHYQGKTWTGGVIYDLQYLENLQARDEYLTTWYFQLGFQR